LGLEDSELPDGKKIETITPADMTEEFLNKCKEGMGPNADLATVKLYL
jgi:hypothetical protein